jgi:hypothetical protein
MRETQAIAIKIVHLIPFDSLLFLAYWLIGLASYIREVLIGTV